MISIEQLGQLNERLNLLNIQLASKNNECLGDLGERVFLLEQESSNLLKQLEAEMEVIQNYKTKCRHALEILNERFKTDKLNEIKESEFTSIPKYMKGRITLEKINAAVDLLNFVLDEKYALLKANPSKLGTEQRKRYYDAIEEECDEVDGKKFVTEKNIRIAIADGHSTKGFKLDPSGRNILSILRHLGRIKEIRSPGIVRFVLQ